MSLSLFLAGAFCDFSAPQEWQGALGFISIDPLSVLTPPHMSSSSPLLLPPLVFLFRGHHSSPSGLFVILVISSLLLFEFRRTVRPVVRIGSQYPCPKARPIFRFHPFPSSLIPRRRFFPAFSLIFLLPSVYGWEPASRRGTR